MKNPDVKILMEKPSPGFSMAKAIAFKQLAIPESQPLWGLVAAQDDIVNKTFIALRRIIINTNK